MIEKTYVEKDGVPTARVTFSLPSCVWAESVHLVGDLNDWSLDSLPFQRARDGAWVLSLDLPCGRAYQFRYLCDGVDWTNDSHADAYVLNQHGSDNCVLITDPLYKRFDR